MCCCLSFRTPDEMYTLGLQQMYAVNPQINDQQASLSKQDIKAFIVALKTLKKAADQGQAGACFSFGEAVWNCVKPNVIAAIEQAFQNNTPLQPVEYNSFGKKSVLLDFRRALAQRYLLIAFHNECPGSEHKLKEIQQYAAEQRRLAEQAGLIDLTTISYQKH